jgi:hypothetical protein
MLPPSWPRVAFAAGPWLDGSVSEVAEVRVSSRGGANPAAPADPPLADGASSGGTESESDPDPEPEIDRE